MKKDTSAAGGGRWRPVAAGGGGLGVTLSLVLTTARTLET